jgi:hypothetical protein
MYIYSILSILNHLLFLNILRHSTFSNIVSYSLLNAQPRSFIAPSRIPATLQRTQYRLQNRSRAVLSWVGLCLRILPLDILLVSPRPLRLHVRRRSPASHPVGISNIVSACSILPSTKGSRAIAAMPVCARNQRHDILTQATGAHGWARRLSLYPSLVY